MSTHDEIATGASSSSLSFLIGAKEAAALLGVSYSCFAKWIQRGSAPGLPEPLFRGRRRYFSRYQIERWARGESPLITVEPTTSPIKRGRGRPRKGDS